MVFSKEWFSQHQNKILTLLNNPITKRWFRWCLRIRQCDCPLSTIIVQITPNSFTYGVKRVGKRKVEMTTDFRSHDKYAKRMYYAFKPLWWTIHFIDWVVLDRFELPSFGFDTLTVYPNSSDSVDGYVRRQATNETFSTLRSGAGTASGDTDTDINCARVQAHTTSNRFQIIQRGIILFNTSSLTASATISAAVISLYGQDKVGNLGTTGFECDIVSSTPASNTTLASSDYGNLGTTVFSSISYASFSTSAYNDFTLDSNGIANISKTSISKFGTRASWDTDNSFGGAWVSNAQTYVACYMSDASGTSTDPKLVITYTLPILNNNFLIMF